MSNYAEMLGMGGSEEIYEPAEVTAPEPVQEPETPVTEEPAAPSSEATTEAGTPVADEGKESEQQFLTLPDDFKVPEKFEKESDEIAWYRERYTKLGERFSSPQFGEQFIKTYEQQIIETELKAQNMLTEFQALRTNPREYLRQHFPEALVPLGVNPVLSMDEIAQRVEQELAKEYGGEGYKDQLNTADLLNPNSFTAQVAARSVQLHAQLAEQNEKSQNFFKEYNEKIAQGNAPADDKAIAEFIEKSYTDFEKAGIKREEYNAFVEEAKGSMPSLYDIYRAKNFDKLLSEGKKASYEEGKKAALDEFRKAGSHEVRETPVEKPVEAEMDYWEKQRRRGNPYAHFAM